MKEQIKDTVQQFSKTAPYRVIFNTNNQNLGYDRNLKKLISLSSGDYVFFISDDDALYPEVLDHLIDYLNSVKTKPALIFSPFWYGPFKDLKRKYNHSHKIESGYESAVKYLYDSILFSGLIFRRGTIKDLDAEKFKNLNYFQVYMFLTVIYKFGGFYFNEIMINSISDGENAYGNVDSSGSNTFLADRNSIFSNLEFNKGLFKAIKYFDQDCNTNVFPAFAREFSNRTYGGLCRARQHGLKQYRKYWKQLNESIGLSPIAKIYYLFIAIFGARFSSFVFAQIKKIVYHVRAKV
jgi:glycosyltransferase involved in cell wall biosynthesis